MIWWQALLIFIGGIAAGLILAYILKMFHVKSAKVLSEEFLRENEEQKYRMEEQRQRNEDKIIETIKLNFGDISMKALKDSTTELLKLADSQFKAERDKTSEAMDGKKELIDQQLKKMTNQLEKVSTVVNELEKDREKKFGELTEQIKQAGVQTSVLAKTTEELNKALASSATRGQWGERMAEDVLRLAGFVEGINYQKQQTIDGTGTRPDFTFFLPKNLILNMDVKFPWSNYQSYIDAETDQERVEYRSKFLKDVKARIKEVTTREYISSDQNTVDYVLLFIPNEQVYSFIQEFGSEILDEGIKSKVICCSPMTLFAVLAVIRQAVDNFSLEQQADKMLSLIGKFKKQWGEYSKKFDSLGNRLKMAQEDYEALSTTRARLLKKPMDELDSIREQRGLPASESNPDDITPPPTDPDDFKID